MELSKRRPPIIIIRISEFKVDLYVDDTYTGRRLKRTSLGLNITF